MKFFRLFILLLPACLLACAQNAAGNKNDGGKNADAQVAGNPTKRALIFAIGNYPKDKGWPTISSLTDVGFMQKALVKQGFSDKNIQIVTDANATLSGIKLAFTNLINTVNKGDIIAIHFSCHGEQVQADNKNKIDGLDECVVTYNAVSPRVSKDFDKDQAKYLRGHVLGSYLKQLRAKLGSKGDVVVFMDFCHSGAASRGIEGEAKIRGGQPPLVSKNFDPSSHKPSDSSYIGREESVARGDESGLASIEIISATRPEEVDNEAQDENGNWMGSLTYAVTKAFEKVEPGSTYRSFFAQVQMIMNVKVPAQHSLLEGTGTDRSLLGGAYIAQKPYVEVDRIQSPNEITLKQGLLAGLDAGAKIELYAAGTNDPALAKKITGGVVTSTDNFSCIVKLDKDITVENPVEVWAFVTAQVFKMERLAIGIETKKAGPNFTPAEQLAIKTGLNDFKYAMFGDKPVLVIAKGSRFDSLKLSASGYLFDTITSAAGEIARLKEKLQHFVQNKFLQTLNVKDRNTNIELKLVPVINEIPDTLKVATKLVSGMYEYNDGDTMTLWVKNKGQNLTYVNVLDMQPDGGINAVLPNRGHNIYSYDLKIQPGESFIFSNPLNWLTVSPPCGTEVFKVFASLTEIDMESIANTHGTTTRGNLTALEELFKDSYNSRGVSVVNNSNANGSAFNVLFRIKPRK